MLVTLTFTSLYLVKQLSHAEGEESRRGKVYNLFLWLEAENNRVACLNQDPVAWIIDRIIEIDSNRQLPVARNLTKDDHFCRLLLLN